MQDSDKRETESKKPWQLSFYMIMMGIGLGILILGFLLLLVGGGLSGEYGIFMVCSNLLFLLVSGATLFLLEKRKKSAGIWQWSCWWEVY